MIKHMRTYEEFFYPTDREEVEIVGVPSGEVYRMLKKDLEKVSPRVTWSENLQSYCFRDKDYEKIMDYLLIVT